MKTLLRLVLAAAIAALGTFTADSVMAQGYGCGCYSPGAYGSYGVLRRANQRIIPYFAEHPPVYYSYPVARPYGFSPYALPPGVLPAELKVAPQPEEIINPYYRPEDESDDATTTTADRTAGVIYNPFFSQRSTRNHVARRVEQ